MHKAIRKGSFISFVSKQPKAGPMGKRRAAEIEDGVHDVGQLLLVGRHNIVGCDAERICRALSYERAIAFPIRENVERATIFYNRHEIRWLAQGLPVPVQSIYPTFEQAGRVASR